MPPSSPRARKFYNACPALGGRVIDTAAAYGRSEEVIGELLASLGNRKDYFLATKTPMGSLSDMKAAIDESFRRLRTDHIELLQVHNMNDSDKQLPAFIEYKQAKKIRYLGVTTSQDGHYDEMLRVMRAHKLDFIQVDYSIGNRGAEEKILPLAQERGIAVLANVPLGGRRGSLISSTRQQAAAAVGERDRCDVLGAAAAEVRGVASGGDVRDSGHDEAEARGRQSGGGARPAAGCRDEEEDGGVLGDGVG